MIWYPSTAVVLDGWHGDASLSGLAPLSDADEALSGGDKESLQAGIARWWSAIG